MKFPRIVLALVFVFAVSCKKDDNQDEIASIAGHWHILDFEASSTSPVEESQLAKLAIAELIARPCDPMEFTFGTGGYLSYKDGMKYLEISSTDEGIEVACAPQVDFKEGTFDFDGSTLRLNFDDGGNKMYPAGLEGENFTIQVVDLSINGVLLSGKIIFMRETGH